MRIGWEKKITNEEVRRRVRCKKNTIQRIMESKLNLFGHICRMKLGQQAGEGGDVWNDGRRIEERKTMQRKAG